MGRSGISARSGVAAQRSRCHLVHWAAAVDAAAVLVPCDIGGDQIQAHVVRHARWLALQRIAVTAAARQFEQIAGSFVYGLSAALYGEITLKDGAVEQTNFDSCFWGGVCEPTIAVAAPSVLNAVHEATGKRVRILSLINHDLKKGV